MIQVIVRRHNYILFFGLFLILGCVKDVDFDQVDDIEINTSHNISLTHFDMATSDFLDDFGNEFLSRRDTTALPIFGGSYTVSFLNQAEFKYKFSNTFDRDISFEIEFLDQEESSLFKLDRLYITANSSNQTISQTLDEFQLNKLFYTEKIVVNLILASAVPPLDESELYSFTSQMAVLLHYKVETTDE